MKQHYKFAALVLAGVLGFQAISPLSVLADNDELHATETVNAVEEAAEESVEEATEEVVDSEETEISFEEPVINEEAVETGVVVRAEENDTIDKTTEENTSNEEEEKAEEINFDELEMLEPKDGEDFNEDGISDLMTKLLCDGEILTEDGKKAFGDKTYLEVQASNDLDADGLLNGEEVKIQVIDGKEYAVLISNPLLADSDNDGIMDFDEAEEDRMLYGINGGVVGSIRLVARHRESSFNPVDGHVGIVYTSYVDNLTLSIDSIYKYYVTNDAYKEQLQDAAKAVAEGDYKAAEIVSWRSTVDEVTEANETERTEATNEMFMPHTEAEGDVYHKENTPASVTLNRGDYVTIGQYTVNYVSDLVADYYELAKQIYGPEEIEAVQKLYEAATGEKVDYAYVSQHLVEVLKILGAKAYPLFEAVYNSKTPGGVCFNQELYNQKVGYDQAPNMMIEHDITMGETEAVLGVFGTRGKDKYNVMHNNCASIAVEAWNTAFGTCTDSNGHSYYIPSGISYNGYNIDLPLIVKNTIRIMGMIGVEGYVGSKPYITGKVVEKYVPQQVATPKTFDIVKLFIKKVQPEVTPGNTGADKPANTPANTPIVVVPSQSTSNQSVNVVANAATVPAELVTATDILLAAPQATPVANTKVAPAKATVASTSEASTSEATETEEEEEAVETEEESKGNTVIDSKETTTINDEEAPLAIQENVLSLSSWIAIFAVAALAIAFIIVVIAKKRNK